MLLLAQIASAQVSISEIMYDPQGGDTGHEWVEIINQGSAPVDIAHSKFVEGGSSHGLTVVQGEPNLAAGAYAIIADNAQIFLSDHAGFSGVVFDSAFSLKNTGETVAFKMPDGTISDTVTYTSDMGAAGDGNSLQKISSAWRGGTPTPCVASASLSAPQETNSIAATPSLKTSPAANSSTFPVDPQIIADAGPSLRNVSVGAPITFTGRVLGLKKEPIENARLVWSFGDGARGEGVSVSHTYYYPGDYIVVLDAASGYYSASDRVTVRVNLPFLVLRTGGDIARSFVSVENHGVDEVDLSLWQVVAGGKIFVIPQNTILAARKTLTLASEVSGLVTPAGSEALLNFPNGSRVETKTQQAAFVEPPQKIIEKPKTIVAPQKSASATYVVPSHQEASVSDAFLDTQASPQGEEEGSLWPWYSGAAFLGVLALLGVRLTRRKGTEDVLSADDFEIIEETEPH